MDTKQIIWKNVQSLMEYKYGKDNLWQFCKFVGIGPASGTRIKECETSIGVDVLDKIAEAFDLETWHLLVPHLDPRNPPVFILDKKQQEFFDRMKSAYKDLVTQ